MSTCSYCNLFIWPPYYAQNHMALVASGILLWSAGWLHESSSCSYGYFAHPAADSSHIFLKPLCAHAGRPLRYAHPDILNVICIHTDSIRILSHPRRYMAPACSWPSEAGWGLLANYLVGMTTTSSRTAVTCKKLGQGVCMLVEP